MKFARRLIAALTLAVVITVSAAAPAWATNTDRFVYVTANGINKTLKQAIIDGNIGGGPTWYQEAPSGSCNGSNVTFTAAHVPASALAVELSIDGTVQRNGGGLDFSVSGSTITLSTACAAGQAVWIKYN